MKISVIINTFNSALYLDEVLRCVSSFDDVLVCDMGSTDATLDIAREHDARIIYFDYAAVPSLEKARKFAVDNAMAPWVLVVEPNELVTPHLRKYIYDFAESNPESAGLFVPRRSYIQHRLIKNSYPDYRLRFFRRAVVKWPEKDGTTVTMDGELGSIPASRTDTALIHMSRKFEHGRDRAGRAIYLGARRNMARKATVTGMVWRPLATFLSTYVGHGAIFYGKEGFIASVENACEVFQNLAAMHKAKHLQIFNEENKIYDINIDKVIRTRE